MKSVKRGTNTTEEEHKDKKAINPYFMIHRFVRSPLTIRQSDSQTETDRYEMNINRDRELLPSHRLDADVAKSATAFAGVFIVFSGESTKRVVKKSQSFISFRDEVKLPVAHRIG